MMQTDRTDWEAEIQRNGELIAAALDDARSQMDDDADAGNALAFAVSIALPPDTIEPFIDSLRAFAKAKAEATN